MSDTEATITYEGPPEFASELAKALADEELQVSYEGPTEYRHAIGIESIIRFLVAYAAGKALDETIDEPIKRAVRAIKSRLPGVSVKDENGEEID